jgi:glycerophosphoryl diester phosphodiesterase
MKRLCVLLLTAIVSTTAYGGVAASGDVKLLCHRTANEDVPENTLESLEQAALLGCDVVEIDLRRTLDGKIVLNHDGVLEHLTDGIGVTENSYYGDLRLRDAGSWMSERFTGLHMTTFEDALRVARERNIRLILDIKDRGIAADVLALLKREGMLQHVQFGGELQDVKQLYPKANENETVTVWVDPGVTAEQVRAFHHDGKAVIANFSVFGHQMDMDGMKAAVAAGVDGINVDYPRLGADAVGRPVEHTLEMLAAKASAGESTSRSDAILELSRYRGFPLQAEFVHWLLDSDDNVSRAAALALVTARPRTLAPAFAGALKSAHADVRANAAWALGMLEAPSAQLLPLLLDKDPRVLRETLMALSRTAGNVSAQALLPVFHNEDPVVRGAAALALARHRPEVALTAVPAQLRRERNAAQALFNDYVQRGRPHLTNEESQRITRLFECQIKMVDAIALLHGQVATAALEEQAFHPTRGEDFSFENDLVSGFQLWDRIGDDPSSAIKALGSPDNGVAERAEWMLIKAGAAVLPEVRKALNGDIPSVRERAIRIVAWQGDAESVQTLRAMQQTDKTDAALIAWAIEKIESLHPKLQ